MMTVDFVTRGEGEWKMVLVEQGPWRGPVDEQLRRIQDRLYGCLDAVLDGQLAAKFPESLNKRIVIRLDCYDVPKEEVATFFDKFAKGVFGIRDYRHALDVSQFVSEFAFEVNFDLVG
jgi:hypothetical protein